MAHVQVIAWHPEWDLDWEDCFRITKPLKRGRKPKSQVPDVIIDIILSVPDILVVVAYLLDHFNDHTKKKKY